VAAFLSRVKAWVKVLQACAAEDFRWADQDWRKVFSNAMD
jgi:hypothetical protein